MLSPLKKFLLLLPLLAADLGAAPYRALLDDGQRRLLLEVADTPAERARGYMFRPYIPPHAGMIFLFDEPQELSFWMKNTWLPLDIRFYDADGRLIQHYGRALPCKTPVCASYPSNGAALFVVETRARGAEKQPVSPRIKSLRFLAF